MYGVPEDKVTPDMWRNAKVINFGVLYGASPGTIKKALENLRNKKL